MNRAEWKIRECVCWRWRMCGKEMLKAKEMTDDKGIRRGEKSDKESVGT